MKASRTILAVLLLCSIIAFLGFIEDREVKRTHKKIVIISNPPAPPVRDFFTSILGPDHISGLFWYLENGHQDSIRDLNFGGAHYYAGGRYQSGVGYGTFLIV